MVRQLSGQTLVVAAVKRLVCHVGAAMKNGMTTIIAIPCFLRRELSPFSEASIFLC